MEGMLPRSLNKLKRERGSMHCDESGEARREVAVSESGIAADVPCEKRKGTLLPPLQLGAAMGGAGSGRDWPAAVKKRRKCGLASLTAGAAASVGSVEPVGAWAAWAAAAPTVEMSGLEGGWGGLMTATASCGKRQRLAKRKSPKHKAKHTGTASKRKRATSGAIELKKDEFRSKRDRKGPREGQPLCCFAGKRGAWKSLRTKAPGPLGSVPFRNFNSKKKTRPTP